MLALEWGSAAIVDYIADDTPDAAQALKDEIKTRAAHLPQSPRVNRRAKLTPYRRPKLTPLCIVEIRA